MEEKRKSKHGVRISRETGAAYADTREVIESELARIRNESSVHVAGGAGEQIRHTKNCSIWTTTLALNGKAQGCDCQAEENPSPAPVESPVSAQERGDISECLDVLELTVDTHPDYLWKARDLLVKYGRRNLWRDQLENQ